MVNQDIINLLSNLGEKVDFVDSSLPAGTQPLTEIVKYNPQRVALVIMITGAGSTAIKVAGATTTIAGLPLGSGYQRLEVDFRNNPILCIQGWKTTAILPNDLVAWQWVIKE